MTKQCPAHIVKPDLPETASGWWLRGMVLAGLCVAIGVPVAWAESRREAEADARKQGAPMVWISDGVFMMGSSTARQWSRPLHEVYVNAFYLDQFEVTVAHYARFLDAHQDDRQGFTPKLWEQADRALYGDRPVIGLSWHAADAYCRWVEKRLPTEAEWEKAARTTDQRIYPWGNREPTFSHANYAQGASGNTYGDSLRPVGSYEAGKSSYGVYDMAGNASEWVSDWYGENYYATSPKSNPEGPSRGVEKVLRGGSFLGSSLSLKATARDQSFPSDKARLAGVRCAQNGF